MLSRLLSRCSITYSLGDRVSSGVREAERRHLSVRPRPGAQERLAARSGAEQTRECGGWRLAGREWLPRKEGRRRSPSFGCLEVYRIMHHFKCGGFWVCVLFIKR